MLNILHLRLHSQHITHQPFERPAAMVAWMGAIQGQDYPGAKWSVGLRLPGSTDAEIEQAIAGKHILRTWAMRGTLHFVAAEDIRWMVALVAPGIIQSNSRRYGQLELDEDTLARSTGIIARAVQDQPFTRKQLFVVLEENGISTAGQRGVYMLQHASLKGLVCQSVMQGHNNPTFIPMPTGKSLPLDEAAAELARRYFSSRGPATLKDFTWWSGLRAAATRAAFEEIKSRLTATKLSDQVYWRSETPAPEPYKSSVYLLPGFDEYLLGYENRSAVLDAQHIKQVFPGGGTFYPTVVTNGQVVGTWKSAVKRGTLIITPNLFGDAPENAPLELAIKTYGAFMGMNITLP